jgi:hypothetical protein
MGIASVISIGMGIRASFTMLGCLKSAIRYAMGGARGQVRWTVLTACQMPIGTRLGIACVIQAGMVRRVGGFTLMIIYILETATRIVPESAQALKQKTAPRV